MNAVFRGSVAYHGGTGKIWTDEGNPCHGKAFAFSIPAIPAITAIFLDPS